MTAAGMDLKAFYRKTYDHARTNGDSSDDFLMPKLHEILLHVEWLSNVATEEIAGGSCLLSMRRMCRDGPTRSPPDDPATFLEVYDTLFFEQDSVQQAIVKLLPEQDYTQACSAIGEGEMAIVLGLAPTEAFFLRGCRRCQLPRFIRSFCLNCGHIHNALEDVDFDNVPVGPKVERRGRLEKREEKRVKLEQQQHGPQGQQQQQKKQQVQRVEPSSKSGTGTRTGNKGDSNSSGSSNSSSSSSSNGRVPIGVSQVSTGWFADHCKRNGISAGNKFDRLAGSSGSTVPILPARSAVALVRGSSNSSYSSSSSSGSSTVQRGQRPRHQPASTHSEAGGNESQRRVRAVLRRAGHPSPRQYVHARGQWGQPARSEEADDVSADGAADEEGKKV
mmetsp:Transcript_30085/g.68331  ORF Transcript_30085/g.68331 Transcript_30085/m.68331 type:complete len:390 (+) Transcript_30085:78-1247(+)